MMMLPRSCGYNIAGQLPTEKLANGRIALTVQLARCFQRPANRSTGKTISYNYFVLLYVASHSSKVMSSERHRARRGAEGENRHGHYHTRRRGASCALRFDGGKRFGT